MKKIARHLSELDIKYIYSKLGRVPTDSELKFIELILYDELENRDYLGILNRLNSGAKREVSNKIELDDKNNLFVNTGFKIIDKDQSLLIERDETKYINKINNLDTILDCIVINSSKSQNVELLFQKEIDIRKNSKIIGGRIINDEHNGIIFSSSIGLRETISTDEKVQLNNSLVYKIDFGKRYFKKNIIQLNNIIDAINNEAWFLFARSINWKGLGVALIDLIRETNHGVHINSEEADIVYFSDDKILSALMIIKQESEDSLNTFCKKNDIHANAIGRISVEPILHIIKKNSTFINLPISVFDLQYNINVQHFKQSKIEIKTLTKISKKYRSTSFSSQLLKLITKITEDDVLWKFTAPKKKLTNNYASYGLFSNNDSIDDHIVLTHADKNYLLDIAPRLSGHISIANAVRRLACTGAKPKAVIIQNVFPKINENYLWTASELLQGQEEAIRELEVKIGSRSIDTFEDYWYQNISAIGIHSKTSTKMDISFKQTGDFISLLGSHRGELAGSAYQRYISANESYALPSVDLRMENRLQDVVRQGINTNLIKSAANVSTGGISIAIAKSLAASKHGIGARIHLSRKLKDEELLFGETQGLVVVSLSEEDIMEFERICMTIGVPSTTIGRVTDNDLFTFNELIKVKVNKLKPQIDTDIRGY